MAELGRSASFEPVGRYLLGRASAAARGYVSALLPVFTAAANTPKVNNVLGATPSLLTANPNMITPVTPTLEWCKSCRNLKKGLWT
jgi:hypothetical protein